MAKATWKSTVVAESDQTVMVEGNYYVAPGSVHAEYLKPSDSYTKCRWQGIARYHHVEVSGERNPDAA